MSVPASRQPAPASAILTFLIADVRGYTAFTRSAGDQAAARLAAAFAEIVREGVEAFGGTVIELRGDEALAVFGSARLALRAAVELQGVFADEAAADPALPMRVGIGLDAGEAVPVEGGYRGAALNLAARLCSNAGPGEILASEGVVHLAGTTDGLDVRPRDGLALKGIAEQVRAIEVVVPAHTAWTRPSRVASDLPPELDPFGPIVGRDREARSLRWAWRLARRGVPAVRVVAGTAGSGRTRLAAEAAGLAARDGARVVYGTGTSRPGGLIGATDAADSPAVEPVGVPDGVRAATLLVLDDVAADPDAAVAALQRLHDRGAGGPNLTIVVADDALPDALARALRRLAGEPETVAIGALDDEAVAGIIGLYAGDLPVTSYPVAAIARAAAGLPGRIHDLAARWAQEQAAQRLGGAASRAAAGRQDLRRLEAEVASNLIDLQFARERIRLVGGDADARSTDDCPFKGLASFDVADADDFFGRERLVAEMVGRLAGSSFLGIVGPSGSGKSSAMRAGLVPALGTGALPGSETWRRVILRPGSEPMRELDRAVFAALDERLRPALSDGPDPLASALRAMPADERLLVVVDQFEEVFTAASSSGTRDAFVAALIAAAASGRAVVVLAVRADFYGRCAEFDGLAPLLGANHVLVGPMSADEYRRAIDGPARRNGLRIDPVLVDRIVEDVVNQPGGLPLLSTALVELWQRREGRAIPLAAYLATGGVSGAVARLAETAYLSLGPSQQGIARSIFLRLASGDGETVVRRRVPLAELDATTSHEVRQTLRLLTAARLVTVDEGTAEVAHEALLREWPRLGEWLDEDRDGRRLRGRLAGAAREWQDTGRDPSELYRGARLASTLDWTAAHTLELNELERQFVTASRTASEEETRRQARTNRRLRGLLAGAVVALIVAVSAGGLAVVQRQAADQATADAQAQRARAEKAATAASDAARAASDAATAADAQRLGAQALVANDLDLSLLLARQGVALDDSPVTEANLLADLNRSPAAIAIARPLPTRLNGVQASDDGSTLLAWGPAGRQFAVIDGASAKVRYVQTAPEGAHAFLAGNGTIVELSRPGPVLTFVDPHSGAVTGSLTYPDGSGGVSWAPDLATVVATAADGTAVTVYDRATLHPVRRVAAPSGMSFIDVEMHASGFFVGVLVKGALTPDLDFSRASGALGWWGPAGSAPLRIVPLPNLGVGWSVAPDGSTMALDNVPEDGRETLVDLRTGATRLVKGQHTASISGSSFSPDGRTLVTGGDDRMAMAWDVATGELRERLAGHNGGVFAPALVQSAAGLRAYTASLDGSLMTWDLSGESRLGRPFQASRGVADVLPIFDAHPRVSLSPDGRLLAVGETGGATIVDASTLQQLREIRAAETGAPADVAWSPDGSRLALTGDGSGVVELFDTATWRSVRGPLPGPPADRPSRPNEPPVGAVDNGRRPNSAVAVAFSADSRFLSAATDDGGIWTWDAHTGDVVGSIVKPTARVLAVAYDPVSDWLAVGSGDLRPEGGATNGHASVYAPGETTPRYTVDVDGDYGFAGAVAFSPDGKLLATGGGTGELRLWDAGTGAPVGRHLQVSAGLVVSIAWAPTGDRLATGGSDGTVRLVDPATQTVDGILPGLDDQWVAEAFTRDGQRLIAVYPTGQGDAWSVSPAAWSAAACRLAGRVLTQAEWDQYLPGRPYTPACMP